MTTLRICARLLKGWSDNCWAIFTLVLGYRLLSEASFIEEYPFLFENRNGVHPGRLMAGSPTNHP